VSSAAAAAEWVAAESAAPGEGEVVELAVRGQRLLVCRAAGALYAIEDRCPHVGTSLAGGRLRGFVYECPMHGGRLDVRDGSPVELPIRRAAACFAVREGERGLEIQLAPS
jgi:naphthalene 1,2-dioxygenase ferredoxin component